MNKIPLDGDQPTSTSGALVGGSVRAGSLPFDPETVRDDGGPVHGVGIDDMVNFKQKWEEGK
jgi:hypothetical protein